MPPVSPESSPHSAAAVPPRSGSARPSNAAPSNFPLPNSLTRRAILGSAGAAPLAAAFLPACGPPAPGALPPGAPPTLAALEQANARSARPTAPERLPALLPAARMNHAFFRAVRALEIEDRIEPALRFAAETPAVGGGREED